TMTTAAAPTTGARAGRGRLGRLKDLAGSRPGLAKNLAVTAGIIVIGFIAALTIISQEQLIFPWQHSSSYYAVFSDAAGVVSGQHQEVRVAGVHVGQIGSATVTKAGSAQVQMQITDSHVKLYRNAHALLQAKTPLNEMYVALSPGTPDAPLLKPGGTIPQAQTQSPVEIDQILQHFGPSFQNAQRVLLSEDNIALTNASNYLPADFASLASTESALQPVATALATRQDKIKLLITDLDQINRAIGGNDVRLASLLNSAQTTLTTLANNNAALQRTLAELPKTNQALASSLGKTETLATQINPFLDNVRAASGVLPGALHQLTDTLNQLKPVVDTLGPLVTDGTPVVANANQLLGYSNPSLGDLTRITPLLNPITAYLGYDAKYLNGFLFNTASLGSLAERAGGGGPSGVHPYENITRSLLSSGYTNAAPNLCTGLKASPAPVDSALAGALGCPS
ncbi:MAG: MlaD family protein, partial [Acidimicrobiales bacterium]